jgi:RNA polymerase sigma-70 factor (sigma-E family)
MPPASSARPAWPGGAASPEPGDVIGVDDRRASFEDFVDAASAWLFTMALLLTGNNRAEAEDLLQGVLERAYRRWRRICRHGADPAPYVRKMLVNASVDRWRRQRHRAEEPLGAEDSGGPAIAVAGGDVAGLLADRDLLMRALAMLPPGQRAVVVLRYFEDLTEAQTAAALGCSVGSVKSQSSRALARLRALLDVPEAEPAPRSAAGPPGSALGPPGSAAGGPGSAAGGAGSAAGGPGSAGPGSAGSGQEDEVRHGRV